MWQFTNHLLADLREKWERIQK
ncbi:unnamed protein product [Ectocarpus sp. CCAP 1310/34]|nr:unnamed protein product [Ectocarpus sp. CCAP 1310/34]